MLASEKDFYVLQGMPEVLAGTEHCNPLLITFTNTQAASQVSSISTEGWVSVFFRALQIPVCSQG